MPSDYGILGLTTVQNSKVEGTSQMHRTSWSAGLSVAGDGVGVIAHTGSIALRMVAERTGLVKQLSKAMVRRSFVPVHDRGQVVTDLAVMLADGGGAISDINVLRHQSQVLGPVASAPTVWRTLDEITPARLGRIQTGRARVRRLVWSLLEAAGGVPASKVADTDLGSVVVLDVDATIVVTHSEKEQASPTLKRTFGYHPIGVWCDNTEEFLASKLRTGRAGSNTAADHIEVLGDAISQIPGRYRKHLLVRCDGAGMSHKLVNWLVEQGQVRGRTLEYSLGFAITEKVRDSITQLPAKAWSVALKADGEPREGGDVAEVTDLMDLDGWPAGMRVILRRERPHPGAQLSLFEETDGWRYQGFITNTQAGQLQFLEARHRAHARVEDKIRHAKDTGLGRFPSREFSINQAWLAVTMIAADLGAWLKLLALKDSVLAKAEPKALRYRMLHVPARLVRGARKRRLRLPKTWPWVDDIVAAFARIAAIPQPA